MLQVTLARDQLLVGYGHRSPFDAVAEKIENQSHRGSRPSLFFAPRRDAHCLLTRKLHTAIVLKNNNTQKSIVLNFPTSEFVDASVWQKVESITWVEMGASERTLLTDADVFTQTFTPTKTPAEIPNIQVKVESFIDNNILRERFSVEGAEAFQTYVVHWHEPEFGASALLQTTYVDFEKSMLVSYREKNYFSVRCDQQGKAAPLTFVECGELQRGRKAFSEFGNALKLLSSSTQQPFSPKSTIAHGQTDGLVVWKVDAQQFELSYIYTQHMDELPSQFPAYDQTLNKVCEADRMWLKKQKPLRAELSDSLKKLYSRTLLTLRQMQDPTGGIIAAPEFQFEFTACGGYGYCWGRDAGFISLAMDVCGMHDNSREFYRYIAKCQSADGSFLHRHDMAANLGASWGLLQPDETGSVIFGLWQHLVLSKDNSLGEELHGMVEKAANWLSRARFPGSKLPRTGVDLWEEREGVHIYTVAAMYAGLQGACEIMKMTGKPVPEEWQTAAKDYLDIINSSEVFPSAQPMTRTLMRRIDSVTAERVKANNGKVITATNEFGVTEHFLPYENVADISQLGVLVPYKALSTDPAWRSAFAKQVEYIAQKLWRRGVGGIGRYEEDNYRDGNPWILSTLWLSLTASELGLEELARKCFEWAENNASSEGLFPEQVDPTSGEPAWVMPLTWSHAMFALAVHWLPVNTMKKKN